MTELSEPNEASNTAMNLPKAILLMGPTASGKTAAAMMLCEHFPIELISVDSAQVFRDMNIGTSKPDAATLKKFPHHLIDTISPEEAYSAATFRNEALALMRDIHARGKIALLVGGTMLYFKALLEGLADLPPACAETRAAIDAEAARHGWPTLHAELARLDPITAARLATTDAQRIQRALEVYRLSGRPLSALLSETAQQKPPYSFLSLGLLPADRAVLHARIAERFKAMLTAGLDDELRYLRQTYALSPELPSMRCVGYRQVWLAQDGLLPHAELCDRGIYATRQLAKRQITWMKNTLKTESFDCLSPDLSTQLCARVARFLIDK